MKSRDVFELIGLAALWGASFLFMRVGAGQFGVVALAALRVAGAAAVLLPLVVYRRELPVLRSHWKPILVLGITNRCSIPGVRLRAVDHQRRIEQHLQRRLAAVCGDDCVAVVGRPIECVANRRVLIGLPGGIGLVVSNSGMGIGRGLGAGAGAEADAAGHTTCSRSGVHRGRLGLGFRPTSPSDFWRVPTMAVAAAVSSRPRWCWQCRRAVLAEVTKASRLGRVGGDAVFAPEGLGSSFG